jgi:acetyl-CoA carboxylase carboxyl transferase subunit beta
MTPLFKKPKYSTIQGTTTKKKEIPEDLWTKCARCEEMVMKSDLIENLSVCPNCSYHNPLTCTQRLDLISDAESFEEYYSNLTSVDMFDFQGTTSYAAKIDENQKKTGLSEAVICGQATLDGRAAALAIMDFRFLGASMGSVVGEKIARIVEHATQARLPVVIVTASGGARMQEGVLSLMQMGKTSGALGLHSDAGLPSIILLTHPTTGGVTASFASLGDVILAEPGALIGFAGPRVIKQTTQASLPEGFQTTEFLHSKGFIDRIIERKKLRTELSLLLEYFSS